MTLGDKNQFKLMKKAIFETAKIFKNQITLNNVVTKINFTDINRIMSLSRKIGVKIKLLEMTNGGMFPKLYVPFKKILRNFKGENIEYVNSCCPSNDCNLCKKLYPVVRLSPEGKINGCIKNEGSSRDILRFIKGRNERCLGEAMIKCLKTKGEEIT